MFNRLNNWAGSTEMTFSVQKRIIGVDAKYLAFSSHTASQSGYLSICLSECALKSAKQNKRTQGQTFFASADEAISLTVIPCNK